MRRLLSIARDRNIFPRYDRRLTRRLSCHNETPHESGLMCGICGAFALSGELDPAITAALPSMARAIAHRGPDGEGYYSDRRAALGHSRLSIIDRAGGAQPLANEDGTCRVLFNGEIYNHHELRRTLTARGHR